jgi:hypothetical protein
MSNLKSKSSKNIKYKSLEKSNDNLLFNNQNSLCLYIENNNNYGRYLLHDGSLYEGFIRKHKKGMIASGKGNFFMKEFLDDKGGDCYQIYSGNFENGKYHGYGEYYSYNKTNNILLKKGKFKYDNFDGIITTMKLKIKREIYKDLCDNVINDKNFKFNNNNLISQIINNVISNGNEKISEIALFNDEKKKEIYYIDKTTEEERFKSIWIGKFDNLKTPTGFGTILIEDNIKGGLDSFTGYFKKGIMNKGVYKTPKYTMKGQFEEKDDMIVYNGDYVMERPKYSKGFKRVIGTWKNDKLQHPCYLD